MNLPTNKLRDLIAALQTLDPDTITEVEAFNTFFDNANRRVVRFDLSLAPVTEQVLCSIDKLLDPDIYLSTDEGAEGAARDINEMHEKIVKHQEEVEALESRYADLKEEYERLSSRLDNIREVLQSATAIL